MARGRRLACPSIIVIQANRPKYATRDEAWAVVGPVLARILAQTILRDQEKPKSETTRKQGPAG
ncbi:MAG: hypothetical protein Kow0063_23480 [Anaerolineae bacterium]